jgi:hypothetical protein
VHKDFATFYSSTFDAAFKPKNRHTEGESQVMKLPTTDRAQFGKVVHWLCTKKIEGKKGNAEELVVRTIGNRKPPILDSSIVPLHETISQVKFYTKEAMANFI